MAKLLIAAAMATSALLVSAKSMRATLDFDAAPQVNVTLYSESLCPDCLHFILGAWWTVWNTAGVGYGKTVGDGAGIIAWNNVVWGNARLSPDNKTVTCQHGTEECTYNTLEACTIKHYPSAAQWLPVLKCMESAIDDGTISAKVARKCAEAQQMDWSTLDDCWTGSEGHELDVAASVATGALNPPHTFVPWVTLSSVPGTGTFCSNSNCDTFLTAVCAAYQGNKPSACK